MTDGPGVRGAVVLLSGGLDSSTLLHYVAGQVGAEHVHALSFMYGQKHRREIDAAAWQANSVGVAEHVVLDISPIAGLLAEGTVLVEGGAPVPDLSDIAEEDRAQPPTYVPNRNMIFLSVACAWAEARGIGDVYFGAQAQDEYGYWDCTVDFVSRMNDVLGLNRSSPVQVRAPFVRKSKRDVLEIGLAAGVDFSQTWTCYRGDGTACGTCPSCVERRAAFRAAGQIDPGDEVGVSGGETAG